MKKPDTHATSTQVLVVLRTLLAEAVAEGIRLALQDESLRAALVPPVAETAGHMSRADYARSRRISAAYVSRMVAAGLPVVPVGKSYRIDPVAADAWREERGRAPLPSIRKAGDDIDPILARAGIRRVG